MIRLKMITDKILSIFTLVVLTSGCAFLLSPENSYSITSLSVDSANEREKVPFYKFVDIGVSVPAISINMDERKAGIFDAVTPLTFSIQPQFAQFAIKTSSDASGDTYTRCSLWSFSLGFQLKKNQGQATELGATLIPWAFRISNYAFGIGINWSQSTEEKISGSKRHWNIVIPLTYNF